MQILPQRDLGGQIGQALGSGLSESFSKNFQTSRLSKAYKDFQKDFDIPKLLRTPGAAEALPSLFPYMKQKADQAAAQKRAERDSLAAQGISTEGGLPGASNVEEFGAGTEDRSQKLFRPTEQLIEENKGILTEPTSAQIRDLKNQYMQDNPLLTDKEAEEKARDELKTNRESQQSRINEALKLANENVGQILATSGLKDTSKLEGQILEKVEQQLKADVIRGKTPDEAWNSIKGALSDMSAALAKLRGGSKWGSKAESNIKAAYQKFEDLGLGDRFPLYAAEMFDIPVMTASQIVEPVKNKEFIKDAKLFKLGRSYDKMANSIKPEDNIASMMDYLSDRGLDIAKFRDAVLSNKKLYDKLTSTQKTQLLEALPTANDIMDKEFFKVIGRGG